MKKITVFRYFSYSVLIILLSVLQSTPRLIPELFGSKPLLLVPFAISAAAFEKKIPSLIFGALCGLLTDLSSGSAVGFFAISLTLICYFEAHIFEKFFVSRFYSVMIFTLAASAVLVCTYFLLFRLLGGIDNAGILFVNHYISRIIYTSAAAIPVYFVTKFLAGLR